MCDLSLNFVCIFAKDFGKTKLLILAWRTSPTPFFGPLNIFVLVDPNLTRACLASTRFHSLRSTQGCQSKLYHQVWIRTRKVCNSFIDIPSGIHYKNTSRDCLLDGIQVQKYKRVPIKTVSAGSNSKLERYAIDLLTSLKIQHKYTSRQEDTSLQVCTQGCQSELYQLAATLAVNLS